MSKKKKLLFILIAILIAESLQSQNPGEITLKLNSLPPGGLLLKDGWTFSPVDDSNAAKYNYNANVGVPVKPTLQLDQIPVVRRSGIGWFRLKLDVDSSLQNKTIGINLSMLGAAEFYLNGERFYQLGKVSKNYTDEKTQALFFRPLELKLGSEKKQILAIRYSYHPDNLYFKMGVFPNCLSITLRSSNESTNFNVLFVKLIYYWNGINTCIEITAALLTLYFFFSFRERREYLFFGLFFTSQFLGILFGIDYLGVGKSNHWSGNELSMIAYASTSFYLMGSIFYLRGIYALFKTRPTKFYRFLVGFAIFAMVAIPFLPAWGGMIPVLFFPLSCCEILPVYYRAARRGLKGAWILFLSILVTLVLLLLMIKSSIDNDLTWTVTLASIIFLLPAMGLMVFLATDFAGTSLSLKSRILEVEELSKRSIAQEIEKKEILEQQKDKLEIEVQQRTAELSNSLKNLKSTQAQLIQSEKMASLGELTAGIAHEIQNPLNFVNNFSEMNKDLLEEMNSEMDKGNLNEAKQLAKSVIENHEKINHHGKRADAIVKGMLQHSRVSTGQKEPTDINALANEYLRLSYHGMRAKDKAFNAELQTQFDPSVGKVNIVPQEIGRVLLNLYNNAFYAVNEKRKLLTSSYQPTVSLTTEKLNGKLKITVKDNGNGIPENICDKIFQPFFTTKPAGQGTGLGLSLSYDIVKSMGGEIKVDSMDGQETTLIVQLPAT